MENVCFKNFEKNTQRLLPKVKSRKAPCSPHSINSILNEAVCFTFNKLSPGWKNFFSGSNRLKAKGFFGLVWFWVF